MLFACYTCFIDLFPLLFDIGHLNHRSTLCYKQRCWKFKGPHLWCHQFLLLLVTKACDSATLSFTSLNNPCSLIFDAIIMLFFLSTTKHVSSQKITSKNILCVVISLTKSKIIIKLGMKNTFLDMSYLPSQLLHITSCQPNSLFLADFYLPQNQQTSDSY